MSHRRKVLAALAALGAVLTPTAASAAGGVEVRLNEATKWPQRQLVVSLPAKLVLSADQVRVRENGEPVRSPRLTSAANNRKRGVMLVIDSSLTMRGEPIRQAMVAARAFARRRSPNMPVGVIFFSREPRVALKPTRNPKSIRTTLAVGPALTRGTKIYDAASAGIGALRDAGLTSGAVIVLSDGAEAKRGSAITLPALGELARKSSVRIFSVGLSSSSFNASSLRGMSRATGGRYGEAARPRDLPPIFAALGERLSSEYLIDYRSIVPAGSPVQVRAAVDGFTGESSAGYTAPTLAVGDSKPAFGGAPDSGLDISRVVALAIGFFLVVVLALYLVLRPKQRSVVSRITEFSDVAGMTSAPTLATVRRRPERKPSARWQAFDELVELGKIGITPVALVLWTSIATVLLAWYLGFVVERPPLMTLALVVPVATRLYVGARVNAQRRRFEEQLPDNLQVLASALRAGYSFSAGIASMADDASEPSRTELLRASREEQLGMDVAEALQVVANRMKSPEIEYVGIVARMQREAGGNTAEVLDQVIETIRGRLQLKRTVRTLTAQGRFGGAVISASPVIVSLGMAIMNPGYFDPMFDSSIGILLVIAAVFMLLSGWLIIRKIVNVEP